MSKVERIRKLVLDHLAVAHADPDLLPTTLRFVFYELEQQGNAQKPVPGGTRRSKGWPPGSQDITDAVTDLREDGVIPWNTFHDTERSVADWNHAPTVREYLLDRLAGATINPWYPDLPPLLLTESNGMAFVLRRAASEYVCPVAGTKGFSNGFLRTAIAPIAFKNGTSRDVLYLGDLDRAGLDIEANSQRVLKDCGWNGKWERIGLLPAQTTGLTPLHKTDKRDGKTTIAYEVEALGQAAVVALVRAELDARLPEPLADVLARENDERKEVEKLLR